MTDDGKSLTSLEKSCITSFLCVCLSTNINCLGLDLSFKLVHMSTISVENIVIGALGQGALWD